MANNDQNRNPYEQLEDAIFYIPRKIKAAVKFTLKFALNVSRLPLFAYRAYINPIGNGVISVDQRPATAQLALITSAIAPSLIAASVHVEPTQQQVTPASSANASASSESASPSNLSSLILCSSNMYPGEQQQQPEAGQQPATPLQTAPAQNHPH